MTEAAPMDPLPSPPPRPGDGHKGTFGTCLLVGGSAGMIGAIALAARAALRSGVGLCRIGCPESAQLLLPALVVEATSIGLPEESGRLTAAAAEPIVAASAAVQSVAIGPGLAHDASIERLVRRLAETIERPLVLDADGLNCFAGDPEALRARPAVTVLTPHPGEAARLLGANNAAVVQADRAAAATELAQRSQCTVVLKGSATLVAAGDRLDRCDAGNPGMATGGSGDVLTGVVASLLAQGMPAFDAARLAVAAHATAGDLAAASGSQIGLIANDIVDHLPAAWRQLGGA